MTLFCLKIALSRKFLHLGKLVARHPLFFLLMPILLTAALATGVINMKSNRDSDYLFSATNGRALKDRNFLKKVFMQNTSEFVDAARLLAPENIIIVRPKRGEYMFNADVLKELEIFDKLVKNITVSHQGKVFKYSDLCAKQFGKCFENNIIKLAPQFNDILSGKLKLKYPAYINPITYYYEEYVFCFGGTVLDSKGYIKNVKVIRVIYILDSNRLELTEVNHKWQRNLNKFLKTLQLKNIKINFVNSINVNDELKELTEELIPLTPITFFVILLFSIITCMNNDWVRSKPWLGPSACISACLAVISGFGLAFHLGISYTDFSFVLAFVVLGTEIDDAFLQISAWRRTNPEDSIEKRMGEAYEETAVSITITSLTNIISFCIGMTSPFPIIRLFCSCAAIIMFFAYIYQITFFGSCMALSGYVEKKNLNALTFCHIKGKRNEKNVSSKKYNEDYVLAKFRDKIGPALNYTPVKFIVLLLFIINISVGVWGLKFMTVGNDLSDAFSYDSQTGTLTNLLYKHFNYLYPVSIVVDEQLDYSNHEVQKVLNKTLNTFENNENIADYEYRLSWLKYFQTFLNTPIGKFMLRGYDLNKKEDFISALNNVFFKMPQAKSFSRDVIFNNNFTEIIATRYISGLVNISSGEQEAKVIEELYDITGKSPIPIKVFGMNFHLIEQAFLIKRVIFQIALITCALIFSVFFIFIPNISCVICVAVIVFCTILETISFMSIWGAKLDIISLITFILCVGFTINYPTHITFSYIVSNNLNSEERLKKCLYEVGLPIFQGVFTTILSITVLAFQPFYVTVAFFKILFLIAVLTGFHSLFVIPIILSILLVFEEYLIKKIKRNFSAELK